MRNFSTLMAACGAALLVSACGGGSTDVSVAPEATPDVPIAASTDTAAAMQFMQTLVNTAAATGDTQEPLAPPDQLASDDSAEPLTMN